MKIVYCIDSINGVGGIQRVVCAKASALAAMEGNSVWMLVADMSGKRIFDCSSDVQVIDLGVNYYSDDWKSKWHVLKGILVKRRQHRRRLKEMLRQIRPDIVISVGQSEKNFLPGIKGPWKRVREYHFARDYRLAHAGSLFEKTLALCGDLYERLFSLRRYDRIVVLSHEDKELNWKSREDVCVIPNPVTVSPVQSDLSLKRVIAVGRLEDQKNFASLIRSFALVHNIHPDWMLDLFGEGSQRRLLQSEIDRLHLGNAVCLHGASRRVPAEMAASSILSASSKYEGFSLVLLEAMSCGIPIVTYACPCGPKDIITDGKDGFLVPPGDEKTLAARMCTLIENEPLRREMGAAARRRSEDFTMDRIILQWMDLFRNLMDLPYSEHKK